MLKWKPFKAHDNSYEGWSDILLTFKYNRSFCLGSPMLVRLLVRFALGETSGLLVRRPDSWWDGRTLGDIFGLLVRPLDSWWDFWTLGEINYRQDNNIQHWFWLQYRDQIKDSDSDVGDLMMMLMPHSWYWSRDLSPASQTRHQHIWSPTSVTNIDVTENIEDSMSFK